MKKILIIEDDTVLRENIVLFLSEMNFIALSAEDGSQGIQIAVEQKPSLILCDIDMPKLDGYEVFKTLQEITATSTIPFIFLTAKAEKEDIRMGMQLGADDYITKPFDFDELLKAINVRLEKQERLTNFTDDQFNSLLDNPFNGVFIYHERGFVYVNKEFLKIFGYNSKDQFTGKSFEVIVHIEDRNQILQKIRRCFKGIVCAINTKFKGLNKNGDPVLVELSANQIRFKGKQCIIGNIIKSTAEAPLELANTEENIVPKLTVREYEVLNQIATGKSTQEIADFLHLSPRTVEGHRANLIEKTKTRNTAELIVYAIKNKLLEL